MSSGSKHTVSDCFVVVIIFYAAHVDADIAVDCFPPLAVSTVGVK